MPERTSEAWRCLAWSVSAFYFAKPHSFYLGSTILRFLRLTGMTTQAHSYAFCQLESFMGQASMKAPLVEGALAKG